MVLRAAPVAMRAHAPRARTRPAPHLQPRVVQRAQRDGAHCGVRAPHGHGRERAVSARHHPTKQQRWHRHCCHQHGGQQQRRPQGSGSSNSSNSSVARGTRATHAIMARRVSWPTRPHSDAPATVPNIEAQMYWLVPLRARWQAVAVAVAVAGSGSGAGDAGWQAQGSGESGGAGCCLPRHLVRLGCGCG